MQLAGKATKRLKPTSKLRFDDGRVLPLEIDADSLTFHVGRPASPAATEVPPELIVEKSTGYTFRLVDVDGVEGGGDETWQFRVLTDAPPSVVIEQPAADLFVTERAIVNFRVGAAMYMALRQVMLVLSQSDARAAKEKTLLLFNGPDKPPLSSASAFDTGTMGEPMTIDRKVDLSEFQLVAGMQLTCCAAAGDYHAQTGRSDPRVLTVITPDQLLERMAVRQGQIRRTSPRAGATRDAAARSACCRSGYTRRRPGIGRHRSTCKPRSSTSARSAPVRAAVFPRLFPPCPGVFKRELYT